MLYYTSKNPHKTKEQNVVKKKVKGNLKQQPKKK